MTAASSASAAIRTRVSLDAETASMSFVSPSMPHPWLRGFSMLMLVAFALSATAADPPTNGQAATSSDGLALLMRIQQAAQRQNYAGTYVHQQGSQVQSSRVTHAIDKSGEHEKLELMDGQAREFIRNNDDVRCYVPDDKLVLIEKRARYDSFPALLTSPPVDIDQFYRLSLEGTDRIAGHTAQLVVLEARDKQRYGYRLWFDRDSYLLLKAQTVGEKGSTIEQVAFTDVAIGGTIDPSRVRSTVINTDGWRTETNRTIPVDLGKAGWSVAQPVAGFHKVMEIRRAFGGREDIGQMVYSDGLAAISIFIEPVAPQDAVEGDANKGPVNVVTKRHGDFWLTIVGDAPAASIRQMAAAIDFKAPPK
jgi:sigma-E factor negative regulatory protein RseB